MITLTELCREVKNWFERSRYYSSFSVANGVIDLTELVMDGSIQDGQYFRIIGSVFNDGVHKYKEPIEQGEETITDETDADVLQDETFTGIVAPMAIPKDFIAMYEEINNWLNTYSSEIEKPYQSESFGGYSYSLKGSLAGGSGEDSEPWKAQFRSRLNKWRKL